MDLTHTPDKGLTQVKKRSRKRNSTHLDNNDTSKSKRRCTTKSGTTKRVHHLIKGNHRNVNGVPKHTNLNIDNTVNRTIRRHTKEEFSSIVQPGLGCEYSTPAWDNSEGDCILLRCKKDNHTTNYYKKDNKAEVISENVDPSTQCNQNDCMYNMKEGNILVEKSRTMDLLNTCSKEHTAIGKCTNYNMDMVNFKPWGLYCEVQVICTNCDFASEHARLYEEVDRSGPGRRAATGNVRVQVLLQDMPIGPTSAQLLFAAAGLKAGSLTGMQKMAYNVSEDTVVTNQNDLIKQQNHVKWVLQQRGVENTNEIKGAFDVVYGGTCRKSLNTPGPGASQATATFAENVTPQKKILALSHVNKICIKGSRLEGKGEPVRCGTNDRHTHPGCTANQQPHTPIHESILAADIAECLLDDTGLVVRQLCTDSDGKGPSGFNKVYDKAGQNPICWSKDLTHVSRTQRTHIANHKFCRGTFGQQPDGTTWNFKENLDNKKALAHDLPYRCAITLRNCINYYKQRRSQLKKNVEIVAAYMLLCYEGEHKACRSSKLAQLTGCKGGKNHWFTTSPHLSSQKISSLTLGKADSDFILKVIGMKLGQESLHYFIDLDTSSKCEATNRAIIQSLPKNKTFARTSRGRANSAILRVNNKFHDAVDMKCARSKCSLPKNSLSRKRMEQYTLKKDLSLVHKNKASSKQRRQTLKDLKVEKYYKQRKKITNPESYQKNQLDEAIGERSKAFDALEDVPFSLDENDNLSSALKRAQCSSHEVSNIVQNVKANSIKEWKRQSKMKRTRKAAAKGRIKIRNIARMEGTSQEQHIRSEHGYGRLILPRATSSKQ